MTTSQVSHETAIKRCSGNYTDQKWRLTQQNWHFHTASWATTIGTRAHVTKQTQTRKAWKMPHLWHGTIQIMPRQRRWFNVLITSVKARANSVIGGRRQNPPPQPLTWAFHSNRMNTSTHTVLVLDNGDQDFCPKLRFLWAILEYHRTEHCLGIVLNEAGSTR